jgi:hypothetical protein
MTDLQRDRSDDPPWLRETADEDLADLFSDDEDLLRAAVRRIVDEASEDTELEGRLIDLLETSVELSNDDTSASVWTALILGEIRSFDAVGVLLRILASDEDEELQDAARTALLRIGAPAVHALMRRIDDEEDSRLNAPGYRLLGAVGVLADEPLRLGVRDFLETRLERERRAPATADALDSLCLALARLGDRDRLSDLRRILEEDFSGRNPAIEDAIALLEENPDGTAIVPTYTPWEERYGWLFEDARNTAQRARCDVAGGKSFRLVVQDGAEGAGREVGEIRAPLEGGPSEGEASDEDLDVEAESDDVAKKLRRDISVLRWGLHAADNDESFALEEGPAPTDPEDYDRPQTDDEST